MDEQSEPTGKQTDKQLREPYEKKRLADDEALHPPQVEADAAKEPTAKERAAAEKAGEQQAQESVYSKEDLMRAAHVFGTTPEIVAGMMKWAGKDRMTRAEAQAAVIEFLKREV